MWSASWFSDGGNWSGIQVEERTVQFLASVESLLGAALVALLVAVLGSRVMR